MSSHPALESLTNAVIHAALADGSAICIRTIQATDEELMRKGIEQLSAHSRYLRFFSGLPSPPDGVIAKLVDVDGHRHIAWGAILTHGTEHPAIGAVHVFRDSAHDRTGEFSVGIIDAYHGMGLARMLTAVILLNCRIEGIAALGGQQSSPPSSIAEYTLDTALALGKLRAQTENKGLQDVFTQLAGYL